jgi:uncharacterized membrane protein
MTTETGRIEAFSDGVFAIAITLLILEIKIPRGDHALTHDLVQQWPSYLAFLFSFLFIGVMWINHHRIFTHIRRSDDGLLMLNLLLLLGITVLPFPTAVLASHLQGADARTAAALYNATFFAIAIFFNVLWRYAVVRGLLDENFRESARAITKQYSAGPLLYLLCIGLVWVSPVLSLAFNAVLAVFFVLPPRHAAQIATHSHKTGHSAP